MRESQHIKLPEKLPFEDRQYRTITGELSTLHRILLAPAEKDASAVTPRARKDFRPRWLDKDKANLVKIFDDPSIDQETKSKIEQIFAVSPEEIGEYRTKLHAFGLLGLNETGIRPPRVHEAVPPQLERIGLFELNRETGDVRSRGFCNVLNAQELQVLTIFLETPGEFITLNEIQSAPDVASIPKLRVVSNLRTKLLNLTGKDLFETERDVGYKFYPMGYSE